MERKIILPSVGLAALLAACTSEDFTENRTSVSVGEDGRPKVDLVLGANKSSVENDEANSRMTGQVSGEGADIRFDWLWKWDDVIGGALFEDEPGSIFDGRYLTNYAFMRSDRQEGAPDKANATFKTTSPVTVGGYIFYHPYNTEADKNSLGHKLGDENGRIKDMKVGDNEGIADLGGNKEKNFFFSTLNNVAIPFVEDSWSSEATELPLRFTSAYSFIRVELIGDFKNTNTTDYYKHFTVNKLELSTVGNTSSKFVTDFSIKPTTFAAIQKDLAISGKISETEDNGKLSLGYANLYTDITTVAKSFRNEKYTFENTFKLNNKNFSANSTIDVLSPNDAKKKLIYELSEPKQITSIDDKFVLWIPVPAGTYQTGTENYTFNGVQKTGEGALKLEVYTSEGVATFFIGAGAESITLKREQANKIFKNLYIKDDESNIDLYAFNKDGINVATPAEWDYAIDYIENHSYIYSNKTPVINLNADVEIDELPTWELKIVGDNKLTIKEGTHEFNPEKTILGNSEADAPTLCIAEGATMNIKKDIVDANNLKIVNNGTLVLIKNGDKLNVNIQELNSSSDESNVIVNDNVNLVVNGEEAKVGNLSISENSNVTFEGKNKRVVVNGAMTVAEGSVVSSKATDVTIAKGAVTLAPTSAFNVTKTLSIEGTLTIGAEGENVAKVNAANLEISSDASSEVSGLLTITGKLTNNGILTVKKAQGEARGLSGAATIGTLVNNGTVVTDGAENTKNYFGGTIDATTLTNNGTISNNGELVVKSRATNSLDARIKLESDKYALIQLPSSYTNNGVIELVKPENYCSNVYYKNYNKLEGSNGAGSIEAKFESQAQYDAVLKQMKDYSNVCYTAWDVLNKVYIDADLTVTSLASIKDNILLKDVVFEGNHTVKFNDKLTAKSLQNVGNTTLASASTNTVTLNIMNGINVLEGSSLVNGVNIYFNNPVTYSATSDNAALVISGKFENKAKVNTVYGDKNAYKAIIGSTGELVNNGTLGSKSVDDKYWSKASLVEFDAVNEEYYNFVNTYHVRSGTSNKLENQSTLSNSTKDRTVALYIAWVQALADKKLDSQYSTFLYNGSYYKVTLNEQSTDALESKCTNLKEIDIENIKTYAYNSNIMFFTNGKKISNYASQSNTNFVKEYGSIKDYILVTENNGIISFNDGGYAYGLVVKNNGTINKQFTQDYTSHFVK